MKFKSIILSLFFYIGISSLSHAQNTISIDIRESLSLDASSNTYIGKIPIQNKTKLIEWLGGIANIKKILIGTPFINSNSEFSIEYVTKRFNSSIFITPKGWHYAPYTMGTVYLIDGTKINFTMYLSGIKLNNYLFSMADL